MKTDSNGLAVFLDAAQGVKARYHAPYAMPSILAEAGKRAPILKRAAARRTRNRVLAELAAVLIILAGCTIRIPASSSSVLRRFAPDIKPNVWQALSIFALSGMKIDTQEELNFKAEIAAQEAYETFGSTMSAIMLKDKELPEDIRQSIGCSITEEYLGPDMLRAKGEVGGIDQLGAKLAIDQAQLGWKFIRDVLTSIGGYPLDSKVKPWDELTTEEKALVAPSVSYQVYLGDESKNHEGYLGYMDNFISAVAAYHSPNQITSTDLIKACVGPSAYEAGQDASKAFTKAELSRWLARNFLIQVASPITGKPFEPNHREFSSGNGFVTEITNKDDIAKLKAAVISSGMFIDSFDYARAPKDYDWSELDKCRWCYFRIYGQGSVIAEGVTFSPWGGIEAEIGYNIAHPSDTFTRTTFVLPNVMYNPEFWKQKEKEEFRKILAAAHKPAPDYEMWLSQRNIRELGEIAWGLGYAPGIVFSTKEKKEPHASKLLPPSKAADHIILTSQDGLTSRDVDGLPTEDPTPKAYQGAYEKDATLASILLGDRAPIHWFADKNVRQLQKPEWWCREAYTREQLMEIIRAYAQGREGGAVAKVREIGLPYTTLGTDLFLPIYRDFEPYQGYFERADTPSLREKARAQLGKEPKDMIYFRIYGEERVIAEGVWVR